MSNQASVLLMNLKEIVYKLQSENNYLKTQVVKLKVENKQLNTYNKNLTNEIFLSKKDLQSKILL